MRTAGNTWATLQLAEFVTAIASLDDPELVRQEAVEQAAEAFEADAAALVEAEDVTGAIGFPADRIPVESVVAAARGEAETLEVSGLGECATVTAPVGGEAGEEGSIVLAWTDQADLDPEEAGLLRGMGRVLSLTLRGLRVLDERERQLLLSRLSRIQRSIAGAATTQEVFDAITAGAEELLHDEVVDLRLIDPEDPGRTVLRFSIGISDEVLRATERLPIGKGVAGRAVAERRPVVSEDYPRYPDALPAIVADGIRSIMAAPILDDDRLAGALIVATRDPGRKYSEAEKEILVAFAEHASLALRATRAVEEARERELEAWEERFRSLVQTSSEVIIVLDSEQRIQYQSPSVGRLLGYGPDRLVGRSLREFVAGEDREQVDEFLRSVEETPGINPPIEWRWRHLGGSLVEAETVANNLLDDPNVAGIVLTARDLTERRRADRERRRLESQLAQAQRLDSIGQLAGGIAHDFSNLLSVIQHYADFVRDGLPEDQGLRDDLEQIRVAADRGAGLVRQLLAFSRQDIVSPEVVDVAKTIAETEAMLGPTLGERYRLRARTELAELPAVRIDPGQLSQVLVNLVVNARDAMPGGGEILVEADVDEIAEADAARRPRIPAGRYVRITVSDPGSGMDPPVADRAFEPFFTTKPAGEGTGLGLATVHGIVSRAGGYVELDSEPGAGTTVSALLPAVAHEAAREPPAQAVSEDGGGGRAVLVVEDEPAVRALTRRILIRHGYVALEATDGEEALEVCARRGEEIDLLLTDVVMPTMSGKELAERVRVKWPALPVLFMSGYPGDVIAREGVEQGSLMLLQKPFSPESLIEAVDAALSSQVRAR